MILLTCGCNLDIGLSYEGRDLRGFEAPGICKDEFDIDLGKVNVCSQEYCDGVCASKNYKRLLAQRCVGISTCECTHTCAK